MVTIYEGAANTAKVGDQIPANGGVGLLGFQIISEGLDAADAVFKLQQTNDPSDEGSWIDTPDATVSPATGNDSNVFALDVLKLGSGSFRFDYDEGSNTTGTIKIVLP